MAKLAIEARWSLLVDTIEAMTRSRSTAAIIELAAGSARQIAEADGITIVRRIGEETDYLIEDTIEPLWAGLQFPIDKCLAGRAMVEEQTIVISDINHVENIPLNVYLATFIRSLVAVPIGDPRPTHAICAYWRETRTIEPEAIALMEALGRAMGAAFALIDTLTGASERARTG
ncbi:MAG: GAF domain-containing protein [Sphingomonas sp.]|uniref:GAF domain-containing protein n=1 Tax=Sphingomonas sp. TaxID=28214 RepID=UPI000DB637CA|nr:GAF domain-containing protein [Zymomonas sp.]MBA4772865.1 GAF domain-containing protein [Sphingomonas sp.]PZP19987.1 MAG: GAF domain-containing protein [Sphingomonas hengshuiensis]